MVVGVGEGVNNFFYESKAVNWPWEARTDWTQRTPGDEDPPVDRLKKRNK